MKLITVILFMLVLTTPPEVIAAVKDPIVIEAVTKHKTIEEALQACKTTLLGEKFITGQMQAKGFTATRTTGSKADYYVADVTAAEVNGTVNITVSFVKVGSGFLNLKKLADKVKLKLEE